MRILHSLGVGLLSATSALVPQKFLQTSATCRNSSQNIHHVKNTALRHLLVTVAGLAAALLPISVLAAPGDLYEADFFSHTIFKFSPAGTKSAFASGLSLPEDLAFDSSGNLFEADGGTGTIFKFTPNGTKSTFASGLFGPFGLAFDGSGNLYEADNGSGKIFKFTPAGAKSTFASGLNGPNGLAFDSSGNLFEADNGSGKIFKFTPAGTKSTFASGLSFPTALAFDGAGNLFATNQSGAIFKFTPAGTKSTFASGLSSPDGLAFDSSGNLFEADFSSNTIFKFTLAGTKSTFASGLDAPVGLAFEPTTGILANISTRASVQTNAGVAIAGFIITGTDPKTVLIRGIGPTLAQFGVSGVLADPFVSLLDGNGNVVYTNDNWKDTQQAAIQATGLAPPNDLESAILRTLQPGNYTATLNGKNGTTGVGLIEVYDTSTATFSELTNVSTRGFVGTGQGVMIGGFITSGGNGSIQVIIRALGPTLTQFGVSGALADPTLSLRDGNGNVVASNDNWKNTQQTAIQNSGLAPPNDLESAILATLTNGNYTAVVSGKNGGTGVGLVEVYKK